VFTSARKLAGILLTGAVLAAAPNSCSSVGSAGIGITMELD
jgi:hypothetical protein